MHYLMRNQPVPVTLLSMLLPAAFAVTSMGCGDGPSHGDGGDSQTGPLYVMMSQVYDANGDRSIFYPVTKSLDPTEPITLAGVQQESGVANMYAIGGKVLISAGIEPRVTRYSVTDDNKWIEDKSINFAQYGLAEDGANFYAQFVLNEKAIYLPFEITKRIVWNPETMRVVGTYEDSMVPPAPTGMTLATAGNRTDIKYESAVRDVFSAMDGDSLLAEPKSYVVEYDPTTHAQKRMAEAPCAGLSIATTDESGNVYYSTYGYTPVPALYGIGSKPCVVRFDANMTLDATFTTDLTAQTGGRYHANFRYLKNGYAVAGVLYPDLFDTQFDYATGTVDPKIWDEIYRQEVWKLWVFDLNAGTAREVPGVPGDYFQTAVLEGRAFVISYSESAGNSVVRELGGDGTFTERFTVPGDFFKWQRVR